MKGATHAFLGLLETTETEKKKKKKMHVLVANIRLKLVSGACPALYAEGSRDPCVLRNVPYVQNGPGVFSSYSMHK